MNETKNPNWLLDELVNNIAEAKDAILLSADGLLMGKSSAMAKGDSEKLSAIASGLQSLAKGVSRDFGLGHVQQNMIVMEKGYLLVSAAGHGACLAVLAGEEVDVAQAGYQMTRIVIRVGEFLDAAPRENGVHAFQEGT